MYQRCWCASYASKRLSPVPVCRLIAAPPPHLILTQMVRTWSLLLRVARRLGFLIPARPESSPLSQHTFILHCVDQGARLLEESWLDQGWLDLKKPALPSGSSPTWALPAAPCG